MKQPDPDAGKLTVAEAGRRGGRQTLARHGLDHYQRIGAKGAARVHQLVARGKAIDVAGESEALDSPERL